MTTTQIDSDRSLLHIMGLCVARKGGKGWREGAREGEREGGREGGSKRQSKGKARMKSVNVSMCAQHFVKWLFSSTICYS